ncbi:MAG: 6-phosphogluconolactonase [Nitrospirota bacterium]
MKALIFHDLEVVSRKAAEVFADLSVRNMDLKGRFVAALSGGSTPGRFYEILGSDYSWRIEWRRIHFFWVDERFVPPDHSDSNYRSVYDSLLRKIPIPVENIHPIRTDVPSPSVSAEFYEEEIKLFFHLSEGEFPEFDLVLLGMGEDGHTASLFPGSAALKERAKIVLPVRAGKPEVDRITLTLPALNNTAQIVFLVAGQTKAKVMSSILKNKEKERYPAGLIDPVHGDDTH